MILFNLRSNVGSIGWTTANDIQFVLRYEAKNARNGSMVINENDESVAKTIVTWKIKIKRKTK